MAKKSTTGGTEDESASAKKPAKKAAKAPAKKAARPAAKATTSARAKKASATEGDSESASAAKAPAAKRANAPAKKVAKGASEPRPIPILSRLRPPEGAVRNHKRKGRGLGSGLGKTGGRGQKGQKARRPGNFSKLAFEGGQTPLQRRLPKVGFHNPFQKSVAVVNVGDLVRFDANATVDVDSLRKKGLLKRRTDGVKVLGEGDLDRALTVRAHAFSESARQKIEQAGGKVELIERS